MLIGITGGSGSGKSMVSQVFKNAGIPVIDSDKKAREVTLPGKPAFNDIINTFGSEYISPEGELLRKKLGSLVFSDKNALDTLNNIIKKYISEEIQAAINAFDSPIFAIDAPLLIEYGIDKQCDKVIAVIADKKIRTDRIRQRDLLSETDALNRINSQHNDNFYLEKADYIVYNNGTVENLVNQTNKIINQLRELL